MVESNKSNYIDGQSNNFTKGFYKNTYTTNMAAYFVSVSTSPYGQAVKMLKTHQKALKNR